ncbi:MAG: alpha-ketoglutarate-dependent dioxygenase AlkB [Myxococcota bacterium]|nr:alpha-ketoglutarate-dependent dioxygenase AlkB [Myxococcota bacterium]
MLARRSMHGAAWLDFDPHWLSPAQADQVQRALTEQEPWEQKPIKVFGKEILQPRLVSWAGELPYRYSGQTLPPRPLSPLLESLRQDMVQATGVPFNHVLLNRYRDGADYMARHADNEPELGYCPVIAALSFGTERPFRCTPKFTRDKKLTRRLRFSVMLSHGSLMVMGGRMQHTWRHEVPKALRTRGERINLTFRLLKGPPGWREPRGGRKL